MAPGVKNTNTTPLLSSGPFLQIDPSIALNALSSGNLKENPKLKPSDMINFFGYSGDFLKHYPSGLGIFNTSYPYSLSLQLGKKDFSGLKASGWQTRVAGGLRLDRGDLAEHNILLRGYVDFYSGIIDTENNPSELSIRTYGLQIDYNYEAVPGSLWLGARGSAGRSSSTLAGFIIPEESSTGNQLELGLQACVAKMGLCLMGAVGQDSSVDAFEPEGGSKNYYWTLGVGVDVMRFFDPPSPKKLYEGYRKRIDARGKVVAKTEDFLESIPFLVEIPKTT